MAEETKRQEPIGWVDLTLKGGAKISDMPVYDLDDGLFGSLESQGEEAYITWGKRAAGRWTWIDRDEIAAADFRAAESSSASAPH